jgi:hypothetical protein
MTPERLELGRKKQKPAGKKRRGKNDEKGREKAADPARVKLREIESPLRLFLADEAGDEVARDDEEDVYAGKAARQEFRKGVVCDDEKDRRAAQTVNVGPIGQTAVISARRLTPLTKPDPAAMRRRPF